MKASQEHAEKYWCAECMKVDACSAPGNHPRIPVSSLKSHVIMSVESDYQGIANKYDKFSQECDNELSHLTFFFADLIQQVSSMSVRWKANVDASKAEADQRRHTFIGKIKSSGPFEALSEEQIRDLVTQCGQERERETTLSVIAISRKDSDYEYHALKLMQSVMGSCGKDYLRLTRNLRGLLSGSEQRKSELETLRSKLGNFMLAHQLQYRGNVSRLDKMQKRLTRLRDKAGLLRRKQPVPKAPSIKGGNKEFGLCNFLPKIRIEPLHAEPHSRLGQSPQSAGPGIAAKMNKPLDLLEEKKRDQVVEKKREPEEKDPDDIPLDDELPGDDAEKKEETPIVRISQPVPIGNPAALCYLNADLQCLFGSSQFVTTLTGLQPKPESKSCPLSCVLSKLIRAYITHPKKLYAVEVPDLLSSAGVKLGFTNDAGVVLNAIIGVIVGEEKSAGSDAIQRLFQTKLVTRYCCLGCKEKQYKQSSAFINNFSLASIKNGAGGGDSSNNDPKKPALPVPVAENFEEECDFSDLGLKKRYLFPAPVAPPKDAIKSMQDSVSVCMRAEHMSGFECKNKGCGAKDKTWGRTFFLECPQIFVAELASRDKVAGFVNSPELDLSAFLIREAGEKAAGLQARYRLYAMAMYTGDGKSGHYTAYVRYGEDRWFHIDDERFVSVKREEVLGGAPGYLLFYDKQSPS